MTYERITTHRDTHPEFFRRLRSAGYRKHSATVYVTESVECSAPYWDGGSRTTVSRMFVKTGALDSIPLATRTPFGDQSLPWSVPVKTDIGAVVKGGTFRGKSAQWTIYVHPDDLEALGLPTGPEDSNR